MGFLVAVLCFYLAVQQPDWNDGLFLLFLAFVAVLGLGSLGHVLNDWSDIEEDRRAGKSNTMSRLSLPQRFLSLIVVVVIGYLPWFVGLKSNPFIITLLGLELLLFLLYSVRPVRLKRFPQVAIVLDALYAYVNPSLFLWLTFVASIGNEAKLIETVSLFVWTLPMGLRHIVNHHVMDRENDRVSSTPNLANIYHPSSILNWIRYVLVPIEIFGALLFMILIGMENVWPCTGLAITWIVVVALNGSSKFPFVKVRLGAAWMDGFYLKAVVGISLLILTMFQIQYGIAVVLFILFFTDVPSHPLLRIGLKRLIRAASNLIKKPYKAASLLFNWNLYYLRKWVLRWTEERNWGKHYALRLEEQRLDAKGNVAIFNQNFSKFSETFIDGQRKSLDYRTYYYYGHPKPLMEESIGHLMGNESYLRELKYAFLRLMGWDVKEYEDNLLADNLLEHKVSVILVHFGPTAVQVMNAAEKTGIPLIVMFHGYDAWNTSQLEELQEDYDKLFQVATGVIGVSRDICRQLEGLGCAKEKIEYLPAQISPNYFEAFDRTYETNELTFLSVGRFSKTKSPFLLLTAFRIALKELPAAKLVMVGADDGEGLFEVCQMMAKAWNIDEQVSFKGALTAVEVHTEMQKATVFVQHSVTTVLHGDKEGTPVGIMEAMAVGLPIVATDHAGISEMIAKEKTGILVTEYDLEAMAEGMVRFGKNVELRRQMGKAAANALRKNETVMDNLRLISELIDRHKLKR
jgi:colanic acid/amylovoran biosynthesis glycosyltransferase